MVWVCEQADILTFAVVGRCPVSDDAQNAKIVANTGKTGDRWTILLSNVCTSRLRGQSNKKR